MKELQDNLAPGTTGELRRLWQPLTGRSPASDEELRISQAQLAGWITGLIHNIQSAIATRQALTRQMAVPGRAFAPGAVIIPRSSLRAGSTPRRAGHAHNQNPGTGARAEDHFSPAEY